MISAPTKDQPSGSDGEPSTDCGEWRAKTRMPTESGKLFSGTDLERDGDMWPNMEIAVESTEMCRGVPLG